MIKNKLLLLAIVVNLVALVAVGFTRFFVLLILASFYQAYAVFKVTNSLKPAMRNQAALAFTLLQFVPVIGLVIMLTLNFAMTGILRFTGRKVGIFGAQKSESDSN